ncbi:hypothetical protein WDW89_04875 [Deltaproteobacteria bacterium TL4]
MMLRQQLLSLFPWLFLQCLLAFPVVAQTPQPREQVRLYQQLTRYPTAMERQERLAHYQRLRQTQQRQEQSSQQQHLEQLQQHAQKIADRQKEEKGFYSRNSHLVEIIASSKEKTNAIYARRRLEEILIKRSTHKVD